LIEQRLNFDLEGGFFMSEELRIKIRSATLDDAPCLVDFNLRLARESEDKALDEVTLTAGIYRALARPQLCRYFVAEIDDGIVGQMMVTFEITDWRDGVLWWLQSVYVHPDFRKTGVLRQLYDHVKSLAKADPDGRGLRLYVEAENVGAAKAYERLGMTKTNYLLYEHDWSNAVR